MSDAGFVDRMQIIAASPTQRLYWDASETQQFYLYNMTTKTAQKISAQTAKADFLAGNFSWTLPGITAWNLTTENIGNRANIQTNPP